MAPRFLLPFAFFFLWAGSLTGQVRNPDLITLKDDTQIEAFIQEVSATSVSYKKKSDPEGPRFVILKSNIREIVYGNGEKEVFADAGNEAYFVPGESPKPVVYNPPAPANKFEALMYSWDANELRAAHPYFKKKSRAGFTLGIVGVSAGVISIGVGSVLVNESVDANTNVVLDEGKLRTGAILMLGGLAVGATLGTIGFVRGGRNASKAGKVLRELRRRREPLRKESSLRVVPGYNVAVKAPQLSVRVTF